jgi:hypothetical protein
MIHEERDLPTIDSKSGRVMSKPRKSGSPLEWLLGVKQSGYSPSGDGAQKTVAKKKKGGRKYNEAEPEEEEYPEAEEYDEELTADEEDWDDDSPESRYAPISTKISITKVHFI